MICKLYIEYYFAVPANSKFQFLRATVSKIRSPAQAVNTKINLREILSISNFVNFSQSVSGSDAVSK